MEPKVSVVTPAYNAATTIQKCVASIQGQTFTAWEHLVVDDGSTDQTWDILNKLAAQEPRLRIFRQENGGQGRARNTAIGKARGKYVALLDADDWAFPYRLAKQVEHLESNPNVDVLGGAIVSCAQNGSEIKTWVDRLPVEHENLADKIYRQTPFYTSTVMARREFFEDLGGFKEIRHIEDYELWLRGYQSHRFHNLSIPLVVYRRRKTVNWTQAFKSTKLLWGAASRERKDWHYFGFAFRPILAVFARKAGMIE